ncbi:Hypp2796 [Branchiostoma lanceolatum]|uniref:Hypp2796 protein n=1 Tax=Branchiostoma lanceolatum TaxID=7740 RepID=A0A8J9ZXA9_BRALA|nr:Hypp2796 [Branchiostoma lanceolatum]
MANTNLSFNAIHVIRLVGVIYIWTNHPENETVPSWRRVGWVRERAMTVPPREVRGGVNSQETPADMHAAPLPLPPHLHRLVFSSGFPVRVVL